MVGKLAKTANTTVTHVISEITSVQVTVSYGLPQYVNTLPWYFYFRVKWSNLKNRLINKVQSHSVNNGINILITHHTKPSIQQSPDAKSLVEHVGIARITRMLCNLQLKSHAEKYFHQH